MNGHLVDVKRRSAFKRPGFMQFAYPGGRLVSFRIDIYRKFVPAGENADTPDMIGMLVGDDNRIQTFGGQIARCQSTLKLDAG
jgi:hypothetical protein